MWSSPRPPSILDNDEETPLMNGSFDQDPEAGAAPASPAPSTSASSVIHSSYHVASHGSKASVTASQLGLQSRPVNLRNARGHKSIKLSESEKAKMRTFEALDYRVVKNTVYREHVKGLPQQSKFWKYAMFCVIGAVAGLTWFALHETSDLVFYSREYFVNPLLLSGNMLQAYRFAVLHSLGLVLVASLLVVFVQPSAGGGGVPEVMGYLNGVRIPKVLGIRTFIVKFVSCALAVGAGLPVGPEGPMIHMGAIIGAGLPQGRSKTFQCATAMRRFRNTEDKRDFISGGAASGLAAAFGAPIGGVLFVMEEVASFWSNQLTWMIFMGCMVATFASSLFLSSFHMWIYEGGFGAFATSKSILFDVESVVSLNVLIIFPTVVIGLLGGVLGLIFTVGNVKISHWRARVINKSRIARVVEACAVAAGFASIAFFLPQLFPCLTMEVDANGVPLQYTSELVQYWCPTGQYNPMATLIMNRGDSIVTALFVRGNPHLFTYYSLLSFLGVYFVMACYTAGTALSTGFVIPMLVIGAVIGRLIGKVMFDLLGASALSAVWIDPGVFALIGAAAFFGGVSRLTISLTAIILEISNDINLLLPVMLAIVVSKAIADLGSHSLYHTLLEVKCVPFLNAEPNFTKMDLYFAKDIMTPNVKCLSERAQVGTIVELLRDTSHHGFPIIEPDTGVFKGLIQRAQLKVLLRHSNLFDSGPLESTGAYFLDYDTMQEAYQSAMETQPLPNFTPEDLNSYINLAPYMDTSAVTVYTKFSLAETYSLFRSLGVRHLVVVTEHNLVAGIITRKDLVDTAIEERIG